MVCRLAVFVAVLFLIPAPLFAQTTPAAPASIMGVKAGLNVSTLSEEGFSSKNGLVAGGFVRRALQDRYSLQVEALISQQGATFRALSFNFTYFQLPVLGMMSFDGTSAKPFVYAGPSVGLKLSSNADNGDTSVDVQASGVDLALVLGGGADFGKFSADVRYAFGLMDTDPGSDIAKNRVFSVMIGYRLR